jgi:hypothetical protein
MDNLTKEIIKRILANVGATPGKLFGKAGLTENIFKLDKKFKIEYDDTIAEHDIYGGQIDLDGSKIRAILIDLSIDDVTEFIFMYRYASLAIIAIKYVYDHDEGFPGFVRVFNDSKETWINSSMHMKAMALSGFEQITSAGILWQECDDIDDLYQAAITLI